MVRKFLAAWFALIVGIGAASCGGGGSEEVDTTEHDNWVYLYSYSPFDSPIAYVENNHSITSGQPWGGVSASFSGGTLSIDAKAGRHNSSSVADWFRSNASTATCTTDCGSAWPSELNFAFVGTITINGTAYPITIGQGSTALGANDWWIGGPGWTTPQNRLNVNGQIDTPDGAYCIWPDENTSEYFWISSSCSFGLN